MAGKPQTGHRDPVGIGWAGLPIGCGTRPTGQETPLAGEATRPTASAASSRRRGIPTESSPADLLFLTGADPMGVAGRSTGTSASLLFLTGADPMGVAGRSTGTSASDRPAATDDQPGRNVMCAADRPVGSRRSAMAG